LTCFENFFASLKRTLSRIDLYDIWPDFEPVYEESEFTITTIHRLGEVLLLNCGSCDGPSDTRHPKCDLCVHRRVQYGVEAYQKSTGRSKSVWSTVFLTRVIQLKPASVVTTDGKQ
jgi:hypothetical protein